MPVLGVAADTLPVACARFGGVNSVRRAATPSESLFRASPTPPRASVVIDPGPNESDARTHPGDLVMKVNYLGCRRLIEALMPKVRDGGSMVLATAP